MGSSGCALQLGSPSSLSFLASSRPAVFVRFAMGGCRAHAFVRVLLEGGALVAAQEEGGVSGWVLWVRVTWAGGAASLGKGHVGRGRCGSPGLLQDGGWNNDRCLFCGQSELGFESGRDRAGSVGRLTQLFLLSRSSSDTFRVCSKRS